MRLPNEPNIAEHFSFQKGRSCHSPCVMGMASGFYDVRNHIVIDSSINPNNTSERGCAADHLNYATENDLVIYDRGYAVSWLYALHIKHNIGFCIRERSHQSGLIKSFIRSNQKDAIVTLKPSKTVIQTCEERNLSSAPITLRLVRVDLENEIKVLITNLVDSKKYSVNVFKSLYFFHSRIE